MFDDAVSGRVVETAEMWRRALSAVEVAALPGADAVKLLAVLDRVVRVTTAKRLEVMGRIDETAAHHGSGDRSAAELAARTAGTSLGQAQRDMALAGRLRQAPETRDRLSRGEVSVEQAEVVSRAVEANPTCEQRLLEAAAVRSMTELKDAAQRVINAATDAEERHRRIHAQRHLRTWTDRDGAFRLAGSLTADAGAVFLNALKPFTQAEFENARREGRYEDQEHYRADALVALSRTLLNGSTSGVPPKPQPEATKADEGSLFADSAKKAKRGRAEMILLVDLAALRRGQLEPGERCEIPGVGSVPISVAEELFGTALLSTVIRNGSDIRTVAHTGRSPTADQRRALLVRDPVCSIKGCGCREGLEIDHIHPYAQGGLTCLLNLCRLCRYHHRLKTRGWILEGEPGQMTLTRPDRTRQPRAG